MGNTTTLKMRMKQKIDIPANWETAGNNGFIPLEGEYITYRDSHGDVAPGYWDRIKIGDGETNINDLPFATDISTILGSNNVSAARSSLPVGSRVTISSKASIGVGTDIEISGDNSAAFGSNLRCIGNNQVVIGRYNIINDNALFIIGCGDGSGSEDNVFTVQSDKATLTRPLFVAGRLGVEGQLQTTDGIYDSGWLRVNGDVNLGSDDSVSVTTTNIYGTTTISGQTSINNTLTVIPSGSTEATAGKLSVDPDKCSLENLILFANNQTTTTADALLESGSDDGKQVVTNELLISIYNKLSNIITEVEQTLTDRVSHIEDHITWKSWDEEAASET